MKRPGSLLFSIFLLALVGYFVLESLSHSPQARIVPLVVGIPTLALQLVVILGHRFPGLLGRFELDVTSLARTGQPLPAPDGATASAVHGAGPTESERFLAISAWMAGAFVTLYLLGFLVMLFAFVFLFLWLSAQVSLWRSFLTAIIFAGMLWAVFQAMGLTLFEGSLRGAYVPAFF